MADRYNLAMPLTADFIFTKIIATLGPATQDPEMIARLITEGARIFRINFSHGEFDDFKNLLDNVRKAGIATKTPVAVLGDLCGPKIRVGDVVEEGVSVEPGQCIEFQRTAITGGAISAVNAEGERLFSCNSPDVLDDVNIGDRLLIDDGSIRALVIEKDEPDANRILRCQISVGGVIHRSKGINLPDSNLKVESLTDYDRVCLKWATDHDLDYIALSFVRSAADVLLLREETKKIDTLDVPIPIVAKIEKPQAVTDIHAIIEASDAVMVARGDLGVEMDLAEVPAIQKKIVTLTHQVGKPVIVATQMLQSMIENAMPTRAEVSDVAGAIYDGSGAVMLSGETAVGKYPTKAVNMMARTALSVQRHLLSDEETSNTGWDDQPPSWPSSGRRVAALAYGVRQMVKDFNAKFIVIWSQGGNGARFFSQSRANVPIVAASSDLQAVQRMNLLFAVQPIHLPIPPNIEAFASLIDPIIQRDAWGKKGDPYVLVAGEPIGTPGATNAVSLRYVGDNRDAANA